MKPCLTGLLLLLCGSALWGQAPDSTGERQTSWLILPSAFYTPTTGIAGGVAGQLISSSNPRVRPSSYSAILTLTQNLQVIAELLADRYWASYRVFGKAGFTRWPNTFYGVGDNRPAEAAEDFTSNIAYANLELQRTLRPGLRAGLRYEFRAEHFVETDPGGMLEAGEVPGSQSNRVSGLGVLIDFDTRDNIFAARSGHYYRFAATGYTPVLGSTFTLAKFLVDMRQYIPFGTAQTLAVQAYGSFTSGTSPFSLLPQLGGPRLMRGYLPNRYRDNHMLILQAEIRTPVWWRFGIVGFAGIGDVAHRPQDFRWEDVKWSAGAGLRFQVDPQARLNLRIDYGFGEGTSRLYITVLEAI